MSVIPDKISPEIGWRYWRFRGGTLASANLTPWTPLEPLQAKCRLDRLHPSPYKHCGCGIYAVDSLQRLFWRYISQYLIIPRRAPMIFGTVSLWGVVIPGERGWRAEYAYPSEMFILDKPSLTFGEKSELTDALSEWQVPVRVVSHPMEVQPLMGARKE